MEFRGCYVKTTDKCRQYKLLPICITKFIHIHRLSSTYIYKLRHVSYISYRIASLVWSCLLGLASVYLRELCCPLLSAMSSRSLRSSQQGLLRVPFARTSNTFRGGSLDLERASYSTSYFPKSLVTCVFPTLRLLFLAVLESGVPLSCSIEEALYKCSI